MTQAVVPPRVELIGSNAPFSAEQRDWLNGFFAGLISLDGAGITALSPEASAALMPGATGAPVGDGDDGEAPWHDQSLELPDRMKLAEGRPLRRRMMAAMAAAPAIISPPVEEKPATAGVMRDAPALARLRSRTRLNKKGSEKET